PAEIRKLHLLISLPDEPEPVERQIGIDVLDEGRLRRDDVREAARGDTNRVAAELRAHALHEPLDHADVAIEEARFHRANRRAPPHAGRLADADARQLRRALKKRVRRNLHAGTNCAPEVLALRGNRVERRRRAEVDDNHRPAAALPETLPRADAVDDA